MFSYTQQKFRLGTVWGQTGGRPPGPPLELLWIGFCLTGPISLCLDSFLCMYYLCLTVHRVSKNVSPLACYNFDAHEWILIFFGRNVTGKVGNQKTLYYATSNNLCFCITWQNAETRKSHISLNWIVLHTQCSCALSS